MFLEVKFHFSSSNGVENIFWVPPFWIPNGDYGYILQHLCNRLVILYHSIKFLFSSSIGLGCLLGLAAILDPRWRLFQNVGFFRNLVLIMHVPTKFGVSRSSSMGLYTCNHVFMSNHGAIYVYYTNSLCFTGGAASRTCGSCFLNTLFWEDESPLT